MLRRVLKKRGYVPEEKVKNLEESLDKSISENQFLKMNKELTAPEFRELLSELYRKTSDVKKIEMENSDLLEVNRRLTDLTLEKNPSVDKLHRNLYNQVRTNLKNFFVESGLKEISNNTFNLTYYSHFPKNLVLVDSSAVIGNSEKGINELVSSGTLLLSQSVLEEIFFNHNNNPIHDRFVKKTKYFVHNNKSFPLMNLQKSKYDILKQECTRKDGWLEKADLQFRVLLPNLYRRINSPILEMRSFDESLEFVGDGKKLRFISYDTKLLNQINRDYTEFVRFG